MQLGTTYPPRLFAINPPSPAGAIQTREAYPITISNESGTPEGTVTVPTRSVQYQSGYNELDRSATWYDASVLYFDARDNGGSIVVVEDQELVTDSGEVQIVALQNEFQQSGTGSVTLELHPTENATTSLPKGNLTVTIPTRLSGPEYWDDADIANEVYGGVTEDKYADGIHELTLETTEEDLEMNTVGVQSTPKGLNSVSTVSSGGFGGSDDEMQPPTDVPSFDSFSVTAASRSGDSGNFRRVDVSGTVSNSDPNGEIRLFVSSNDDENTVTMTDSFGVTADPGTTRQTSVELTLLNENGQPIETCTSDVELTTSNSPLEKSDFSCA